MRKQRASKEAPEGVCDAAHVSAWTSFEAPSGRLKDQARAPSCASRGATALEQMKPGSCATQTGRIVCYLHGVDLLWRIFCGYDNMRLTWDEAKRIATLAHRGLDFADAVKVFAGDHFTAPDDRRDYGELRYITAGWLDGRFVVLVWTPRDNSRRIISMRPGHAYEEAWYRERMG